MRTILLVALIAAMLAVLVASTKAQMDMELDYPDFEESELNYEDSELNYDDAELNYDDAELNFEDNQVLQSQSSKIKCWAGKGLSKKALTSLAILMCQDVSRATSKIEGNYGTNSITRERRVSLNKKDIRKGWLSFLGGKDRGHGQSGNMYEANVYEIVAGGTKITAVAFKGTKGKLTSSDWRTNLRFIGINPFKNKRVRVHKGFYIEMKVALQTAKNAQGQNIRQYLKQQAAKGHKIMFTGHSQGGGIAHVASYMFGKYSRKKIDYLVTFASPKGGNRKFRQYLSKAVLYKKRYVSQCKTGITGWFKHKDPVTKVPARYRHFGKKTLLYTGKKDFLCHSLTPFYAYTIAKKYGACSP